MMYHVDTIKWYLLIYDVTIFIFYTISWIGKVQTTIRGPEKTGFERGIKWIIE